MSRQSDGVPIWHDQTEITADGTGMNALAGYTGTGTELNLIAGYTGTTANLNALNNLTATTAELNYITGHILDTSMVEGSGITGLVGGHCEHRVTKVGGLFTTEIFIDLTGLNSGDTSGDVIGKDAAAANCHIGRIVAAVNGTILAGTMVCHELPVTGDIDIDLWYADESSLAQDTAISAATGEVKIVNSGDWAAGDIKNLTAWPAANKYLYLVTGADVADADYTAGRFLITLYGV